MANAAESSDTSMQIRKNKRGQTSVEQHTQRGGSHTLFLVALPLQRQQLDLCCTRSHSRCAGGQLFVLQPIESSISFHAGGWLA